MQKILQRMHCVSDKLNLRNSGPLYVELYSFTFASKLKSTKRRFLTKDSSICRWAVSYQTNSTPMSLSTLPEAFLPFVAASKARSRTPR